MLDKTYLFGEGRTVTNNVPYTKTVHEHKAPTDESIRLYEEHLEKARKSLIATISTKDNLVGFRAGIYRNPASMTYQCYIQLIVNGEELEDDFEVKDTRSFDKETLAQRVCKLVAEHLARQLTHRMVMDNIDVFNHKS